MVGGVAPGCDSRSIEPLAQVGAEWDKMLDGLCGQIRPGQEAVFPTTVGLAVVVDHDFPLGADASKLFRVCADRVSHVQRARKGGHPQTVVCVFVVLAFCFMQVFDEPALRKAKCSVDKALNFKRRERMFILRQKVEEMLAWSEANAELRLHALLFLFSYSFLLRTPSEALPATVGFDGCTTECNSILFKGDDESLVLVLRRRKNKPEGSRLIRKCSCHKSPASCAYHIIGKLVDDTPVGARIFGSITANGAGRGFDVWCN